MPSQTDRRQSAWHMSACEDDKKCIRRLARDDACDILHIRESDNLEVTSSEERRSYSATSLSITSQGTSSWVLKRWNRSATNVWVRASA